MAAWKAELHDKDTVLQHYKEFGTAGYRVYAGANPELKWCRYEHIDGVNGTRDQGIEKLDKALETLLDNPMNTNVYCLELIKKVNPSAKAAKKKVAESTCITFQLNYDQSTQYRNGMNGFFQLPPSQPNKQLEERLAKIEGLLEPPANGEDDDDEPEDAPKGTPLENAIAGMINNPEKIDKIVDSISNLFMRFKGGGNNVAPVATKTESDQVLDAALNRLKGVDEHIGSDLDLLATLAEKDPKQFRGLLNILRQNIGGQKPQ